MNPLPAYTFTCALVPMGLLFLPQGKLSLSSRGDANSRFACAPTSSHASPNTEAVHVYSGATVGRRTSSFKPFLFTVAIVGLSIGFGCAYCSTSVLSSSQSMVDIATSGSALGSYNLAPLLSLTIAVGICIGGIACTALSNNTVFLRIQIFQATLAIMIVALLPQPFVIAACPAVVSITVIAILEVVASTCATLICCLALVALLYAHPGSTRAGSTWKALCVQVAILALAVSLSSLAAFALATTYSDTSGIEIAGPLGYMLFGAGLPLVAIVYLSATNTENMSGAYTTPAAHTFDQALQKPTTASSYQSDPTDIAQKTNVEIADNQLDNTDASASMDQESPALSEQDLAAIRRQQACDAVAAHYGLSEREHDLLFLLYDGLTAQEIADKLCISRNTSKSHMAHIYSKLDIHTRAELMSILDTHK